MLVSLLFGSNIFLDFSEQSERWQFDGQVEYAKNQVENELELHARIYPNLIAGKYEWVTFSSFYNPHNTK